MSIFDTLGSVGRGMVERAERERDKVRREYDRGYSSAQRLSDDELKSRYRSIDKKNPSTADYGVARAAKERFSR